MSSARSRRSELSLGVVDTLLIPSVDRGGRQFESTALPLSEPLPSRFVKSSALGLWHTAVVAPSRAEHRQNVAERILRIGRRHLAEYGAAALSLRAVTRELGMVSSAVYRYVESRDELLTLLLVDAYTEQADAVAHAVARATTEAWHERIVVAGLAFRGWGVTEPARYALLYGSPVPGYAAPADRTTEPGTRVIGTLVGLVGEGVGRGDVPPGPEVADPRLAVDLERVGTDVGLAGGPSVALRAIHLWSTLVGATSLEVFGQYGPDGFAAPGALVEEQLRLAIRSLQVGDGAREEAVRGGADPSPRP